jgi:lysophospholipase L1-like esterase
VLTWVAGACAAGAAAVAAAELAARLIIRKRGRYLVNLPSTRTVLDLEPAVSAHLEPRVRIAVNALGERGDELGDDLSDTLRVTVVGGSAAYCYLVDQPSSWPQKMGRYLLEMGAAKARGRSRVHVGNLSQAELSTAGARMIVDKVVAKYTPLDAVVLMIGISDMLRWLRYGAPEHLPLQTAADVFAVHPEGPFSWRPKSAALTEAARRGRERWRRWRTPMVYRQKVGTSVMHSRLRKRNATTVIREVPDSAGMLGEFRENLAGIIEALLARGVVVVVLGQPHYDSTGCTDEVSSQFWNGGVGDPAKGPVTTFYSDGVLDELSKQVNDTARSVAAGIGVPYVHLDAMVPSDLRHYYDQFHFTAAGCDVVARAAAAALAKELSGR